jgi:hypothetical protein
MTQLPEQMIPGRVRQCMTDEGVCDGDVFALFRGFEHLSFGSHWLKDHGGPKHPYQDVLEAMHEDSPVLTFEETGIWGSVISEKVHNSSDTSKDFCDRNFEKN